jgi:hypothetical protein
MTSHGFSQEDQVRLLRDLYGVDTERAAELLGVRQAEQKAPLPSTIILRPAIALPFRLIVPWSALCSDNEHEVASLKMVNGKPVPFRKMTARYKAAKHQIASRARAVVGDKAAPLEIPLSIHVRVYLPSASHTNDSINFAKVVHDGLQGVVYRNDRQLHRVLWERSGIDVDAPRAELEITAR